MISAGTGIDPTSLLDTPGPSAEILQSNSRVIEIGWREKKPRSEARLSGASGVGGMSRAYLDRREFGH